MRALFLVALSPFCLTACSSGPSTPDPRGVDHDETLLRISATGESETRPDTARFSIGLSSIAPTSEAATAANNKKMERVMAAVEAQGVKRDDTQTQDVSVQRIDYGRNRGQYEASNTVAVKVRAIDKAGTVIAAATGAGANILSGPNLSVDDTEAASLSAYAAAYKAAHVRAEAYAKAAGLKVVRVLTITDGGDQNGGPQPMYEAMAEDASAVAVRPAAPPIRAGLNTSHAVVTVTFALGE